jgi:hypothetical protein
MGAGAGSACVVGATLGAGGVMAAKALKKHAKGSTSQSLPQTQATDALADDSLNDAEMEQALHLAMKIVRERR